MKRTRHITAVHLLVAGHPRAARQWASVYIHHNRGGVRIYSPSRSSYLRLLRAMADWECVP